MNQTEAHMSPDALAALLRSERVFRAARDVAEIEYRKHADAGVSIGGSITAATRAALDMAIGAIYETLPPDHPLRTGEPSEAMILEASRAYIEFFGRTPDAESSAVEEAVRAALAVLKEDLK